MPELHDPHQQALLAAAARLGVAVVDQAPLTGLDLVRYGGVPILKGRILPELSHQASLLADDKHATKALLAAAGLKTPGGIRLSGDAVRDRAAVEAQLAQGPVTVKPIQGGHGNGIALALTDADAVLAHARSLAAPTLVEPHIPGADLRIHAIGGRLVAACSRTPPAVTGDGQRSLRALVEALDAEVRKPNPANRARLDTHTLATLATQGLTPDDIPAPGQEVRLGWLANMARGARAIDVTARLHPRWHDWTQRAGQALGLSIYALDALTPDPARDPRESASILELNARPEWLHHTFSQGRTHDIPALLFAHLGLLPRADTAAPD